MSNKGQSDTQTQKNPIHSDTLKQNLKIQSMFSEKVEKMKLKDSTSNADQQRSTRQRQKSNFEIEKKFHQFLHRLDNLVNLYEKLIYLQRLIHHSDI